MTSVPGTPSSRAAANTPEILAANAVGAGRLPFPMLGTYGAGGLAEHVVAFGLNNLLLFYLTVICGLGGAVAGFAVGAAVVVDAVIQPLVGSLSDNSHSRHGRRHPFMLAGALPLAIGFGLLYSMPSGLAGAPLFACATVILLVIRIAHAVFNVPYMALGAELSSDYHERSLIVAARLLCGSLGAALATYLAYGVFMKGHAGQLQREAYAPFAWSCAAIVIAGTGISIIGTLRARHRLRVTIPHQGTSIRRFAKEIGELLRSPSFRALFFMALCFQVAYSASAALGLHANTYFWKLTTEQILSVNLLGVAGFLAGCVLAAFLRRVIQKRTTSMVGMGMVCLCQVGLVPLRLAGFIPPEAIVAAVTVSVMLTQVGVAMTLVGYQSMMADAADQHEHLFGARRQGLYYAGTALAAFAASGIGSMLAGTTLDIIGFPHGKAAATLAIPLETTRTLALAYGPSMGVLTVAAIIILFGYRIGQEEHAAIRDALERRAAPGTSFQA